MSDQAVQHRRVPRLDAVNRQRRGEHFLTFDASRLTEVGVSAKVLDRRRQPRHLVRVVQGEARARRCYRRAAELADRLPQGVDVLCLLVAEALQQVGGLAREQACLVDLAVEVSLEVFERQRVVEDVEIAARRLPPAAARSGPALALVVAPTGGEQHGQCRRSARPGHAHEALARKRVARELRERAVAGRSFSPAARR